MDKDFKFSGEARFKIPEPWYERTSREPWEEGKVSWLFENKYRRLIVAVLSKGPKTEKELSEISVALKPHLFKIPETKIKMSEKALKNHLKNLVWYGLIREDKGKYFLNFTFLSKENLDYLDEETIILAQKLGEMIAENREKIIKAVNGSLSLEKLLTPLLKRVALKTAEILEEKEIVKYEWQTYERWVEEFDLDAFRDWAKSLS